MVVIAWLWALVAAVDTSMATENFFAGGAVFAGLGVLIIMGREIIKATRK